MVREGPPEPAPPPKHDASRRDEPPIYSGEKARAGTIVLRTRAERLIFIVGLIGIVLLALLLWAFAT